MPPFRQRPLKRSILARVAGTLSTSIENKPLTTSKYQFRLFAFADLVHGGAFANLSPQRSHVDDLEGRYVQLRVLSLVRGRQRDGAEAERVSGLFYNLDETAAYRGDTVGGLLSVSRFNSVCLGFI